MIRKSDSKPGFSKKLKIFLAKYGIGIGLLGCAVVAGLILALTQPQDGQSPQLDAEPGITEIPNPAPAQEAALPGTDEETEVSEMSEGIVKSPSAIPELKKPVDGEIMVTYAKDSLVYSETLKEYRTHLAYDFPGSLGQSVYAAAGGEVVEAGSDKLLGEYVVIRHSDRFQTAYYCLESYNVDEGDEVEAGDVIGAIGESSLIEVSQGPHLHFVAMLDGQSVECGSYFTD